MRISDIIKKGYIEKARGQSVIKTASDSLEYILGNYTYNLFKGSVYEDINGRQFEYYGIEFFLDPSYLSPCVRLTITFTAINKLNAKQKTQLEGLKKTRRIHNASMWSSSRIKNHLAYSYEWKNLSVDEIEDGNLNISVSFKNLKRV